ncbi:MmgE/PrpD family protein [Thermaurantiacus tibetensis]|uniref:MmgE/PrpD family protein n=1 Tax=Thermaurantiacus tibetensis TaxID=2759035 RepID=UPI00188E46FB|nr:MmgE/PrpD family protein [Thermaurantiacus tibetensis]
MSLLARLAEFACGHRPEGEAWAATERLVRDTLAVRLAGLATPAARQVEAAVGPGALIDAFAIHCLEWDAVHEGAVVHAMSAVTAAARALCHREGVRDRDEALAAIAAGVEIACLLGVAATSPLAFFRPATAGAVGAAAAAGRLLGLSRERMAHALALGVAQACGTMQAHVEGSVALPLQVGFAARAGVAAADLAAAGLEGPRGALDGPFGYFPLFDRGDAAPHLGGLGARIAEISVKPWPSGRASHGVLDAIARVQAAHPGVEIVAIAARVPPLVLRLVGRPWEREMAPARARLCLPFLVALMLRDGRIDPRAFTPQAFADPALIALGARLALADDGNPDPNALIPQQVTVTLAGGARVEIALPAVRGSPEAPLSPAQQAAKQAFALELGGARPDHDPLDDLLPLPG